MKLLIVESPNKIKKITGYLKELYPTEQFKVEASLGHVDDLAINKGVEGLGFDAETFTPHFAIAKGKSSIISKLKILAKEAQEVFLAMDPDREGEAIAERLRIRLGLKQYKRITFSEISSTAIAKAMGKPRTIAKELVEAQEVRRIADRMIGFKGTKILKKKQPIINSVGRVQTPTLGLVVNREQEIQEFIPTKYKEIKFINEDGSFNWSAKRGEEDEKGELKFKPVSFKELEEDEFEEIHNEAKDIISKEKAIEYLKAEEKLVLPGKPFSTADLLNLLSSKLKVSLAPAQKMLQTLFEGGYITYLRTDSNHLDPSWVASERLALKERGVIVGEHNIAGKAKAVNAQEAHEAIRPISMEVEPETSGLRDDLLIVYKIIYDRTMINLLPLGIDEITTVGFGVDGNYNPWIFETNFVVTKELGWREYAEVDKKEEISNFDEGDIVSMKLEVNEKETTPPPLFTEASLLKAMETNGIGRPSTYASIIDMLIQSKNYIKTNEDGKLLSEELGKIVYNTAIKNMEDIFDIKYTMLLEASLDDISMGKMDKKTILKELWKELGKIDAKMSSVAPEGSKGKCDKCNKGYIVLKKGKKGKYKDFYACNNFPACRNTIWEQ